MKVVYEKSILEKIDDAIYEAKKNNKKIEKFVLTQEEWKELYEHLYCRPMKALKCFEYNAGHIKVQGIKVEVVNN